MAFALVALHTELNRNDEIFVNECMAFINQIHKGCPFSDSDVRLQFTHESDDFKSPIRYLSVWFARQDQFVLLVMSREKTPLHVLGDDIINAPFVDSELDFYDHLDAMTYGDSFIRCVYSEITAQMDMEGCDMTYDPARRPGYIPPFLAKQRDPSRQLQYMSLVESRLSMLPKEMRPKQVSYN